MEIIFAIHASSLADAERRANSIVRFAPPSLRLKSPPQLSTVPQKRKPDYAPDHDPDRHIIEYFLKVETPVSDLTNYDLRKFLDDQHHDIRLVSPKFTTDLELKESKDMTLTDLVGRKCMRENQLTDRKLALSGDPLPSEWRPLNPIEDESAMHPAHRTAIRLGMAALEEKQDMALSLSGYSPDVVKTAALNIGRKMLIGYGMDAGPEPESQNRMTAYRKIELGME